MTYREKLRAEKPDVNAEFIHIFRCPFDVFSNTEIFEPCPAAGCRACWDTEVKENLDG